MYVSQVPAMIIYTAYKTVILLLFAKTIESICSWFRRYDVAKIMDQGSYSVLYTLIFSRNYRKYMTFSMIFALFLVIVLETATNFLPTIANVFMPFQVVSFTRGSEEKYFQATFETPQQSTTIPSPSYLPEDNHMNLYCEAMGLCSKNGSYIANIPKLSATMQVNAVPYDYLERKFITSHVNITTNYCLQKEGTYCPDIGRFGAASSIYNFTAVPGFPSDVLIYYNEIDQSDEGAGALVEAGSMQVEYEGSTPIENGGEHISSEPLMTMVYSPRETEILSVTHLSKILYTNGRETVVLVQKIAAHNLSPDTTASVDGQAFDHLGDLGSVFNNSQMLYDLSFDYSEAQRNRENNLRKTTGAAYTSYITDDYLAVDIVHRYIHYILPASESILKARILFGVYVITDDAIPVHDSTYHHGDYLTNYNASRFEIWDTSRDGYEMRKPGFYDSMLDNFQERPSNDLFMYALLNGSDGNLYGLEGYQEVVADISPLFLIILSVIILALLALFLISKHIRGGLFFNSLYHVIGHTDENGRVHDIDDAILRVVLKDGVTYVGSKAILVQSRDNLLEVDRSFDE